MGTQTTVTLDSCEPAFKPPQKMTTHNQNGRSHDAHQTPDTIKLTNKSEKPTTSPAALPLLIVFMCFFTDYCGNNLLAPVAPTVKWLSASDLGNLVAIKAGTVLFFAPIVSGFIDVVSRRLLLLIGLALQMCAALCFVHWGYYSADDASLASSAGKDATSAPSREELLPIWFAARLVDGIGSALLMASGHAYIQRRFANDTALRGKAMSFTVCGIFAAALFGPSGSGALHDAFGWSAPFLTVVALRVVTVALLLYCCFFYPHDEQRAVTLRDDGGEAAAVVGEWDAGEKTAADGADVERAAVAITTDAKERDARQAGVGKPRAGRCDDEALKKTAEKTHHQAKCLSKKHNP